MLSHYESIVTAAGGVVTDEPDVWHGRMAVDGVEVDVYVDRVGSDRATVEVTTRWRFPDA